MIGGLNMDITPFKGLTWHTEGNGNYTFGQGYTALILRHIDIGKRLCEPQHDGQSRSSDNNYWASLKARV